MRLYLIGPKKLQLISEIIHMIIYFSGGLGSDIYQAVSLNGLDAGYFLIAFAQPKKSNIKFDFTTNDFRIPNGTIIQKPPVASKLLFTCR